MIAFDVVDEMGTLDGDEARRLVSRALQEGLIILTCGQYGQAVRILVPLTVSDDILDEGLAKLELALKLNTKPEVA